MSLSVCVYCSSSNAVDPRYFTAARALGEGIAGRGHSLVYGGASVGLMHAVAQSALEAGARVTGVIPETIHERGLAADGLHELVVTPDLRTRKQVMDERSDAFIALPGGFGTLEELLEVLTLRQLRVHQKPIVLLNVDGFYDPLIALFESLYEGSFARHEHRDAYLVAQDASEALDQAAQPSKQLTDKWF